MNMQKIYKQITNDLLNYGKELEKTRKKISFLYHDYDFKEQEIIFLRMKMKCLLIKYQTSDYEKFDIRDTKRDKEIEEKINNSISEIVKKLSEIEKIIKNLEKEVK